MSKTGKNILNLLESDALESAKDLLSRYVRYEPDDWKNGDIKYNLKAAIKAFDSNDFSDVLTDEEYKELDEYISQVISNQYANSIDGMLDAADEEIQQMTEPVEDYLSTQGTEDCYTDKGWVTAAKTKEDADRIAKEIANKFPNMYAKSTGEYVKDEFGDFEGYEIDWGIK